MRWSKRLLVVEGASGFRPLRISEAFRRSFHCTLKLWEGISISVFDATAIAVGLERRAPIIDSTLPAHTGEANREMPIRKFVARISSSSFNNIGLMILILRSIIAFFASIAT
jgi:hypothetical protein